MRDEELKNWSREVKIKGGWVCADCGELDKKLLDSHHIKPKGMFPALMYDLDNGQCLCLWCHAKKHTGWCVLKILARLAVILYGRLRIVPEAEMNEMLGRLSDGKSR